MDIIPSHSMGDMEECHNFRSSLDEITHNGCVYGYPDGSADVMVCERAVFRESGWEADRPEHGQKTVREAGKKSEGENMVRSMRRARSKLRRLALSNSFEYFVTLTLDRTKIDRYDPKVITRALNSWCDNMVRRHGLRYILVPEEHMDGALHFHGFFAGDDLRVVDSGHKDSCGNPVYNLPQWKLGFSTAIRLYGEYSRAVGYVCKYIGKQNGHRPMGRWYYSGGGLVEPERTLIDVEIADFIGCEDKAVLDTPCGKMVIIHQKMEV